MRYLPSLDQGKYPMEPAYILTLPELQISNLRMCKYVQFPVM